MAARRFLLLSPLFLAAPAALLLALAPAPLRAEDEPEVPNAKYNFMGEIAGNGVAVRSGPSENYYPTGKLDKGQQVKVVGIKTNWLKIEPPPGSFSFVGKAFVERHGDGKQGKVRDVANVRAGSALNPMKTTIQTRLVAGTDVKIQGEEDEYYRIDPPAGAYLYVNKQFVKPLPVGGLAGTEPAPVGGAAQPDTQTHAPAGASDAVAQQGPATPAPTDVEKANQNTAEGIADAATNTNRGAGAATQAAQPDGTPGASAPATNVAAADTKFEQLEADFAQASHQPVTEQPLAELLKRYEQATQEEGLPESLKRVADARIAALKVRQEAREQLATMRKAQEERRQRNLAAEAERQELEERIKETQVDFYTAVGTLRPSSLQQGPRGTTLYRLTDPDTGRTLVYIRSADKGQVAPLLNQFVGVRGELRKDPLLRMNVIAPTEAKAIDQSKLGNGVAAAVMPPSLLSKIQPPTVSTESQSAPVEGQE